MLKINIFVFFLILLFLAPHQVEAKKENKSEKIQRQTLSVEDRRKFDYFFYEAINAKATDQGASAYDYLQYCMQIDSTNANVLFELGNFFASKKDNERAYNYYSKAIDFDSNNFYYNMALAAVSVDKGEYVEAADIYGKLVELNPNRVELYMYQSEAYRLDGDFSKSIESLNELERTMGMSEKITLQKFKLYSALNDKKKAFAEVQKYIDKNPDDVRYYILLGNLYMQDGKMSEALTAFEKAKKIDSENPMLISSLATYYQAAGNNEAAEKELRASLFNEKTDIDTKIGIMTQYIGLLQQNKQDIHKANALLDTLMLKYPQEAKFNLLYGNLLMLEDKKKEANFQFKLYTESDPTNIMGWEQLLQSTDVDSIDALIEVCESAISYLPQEPLFYFYLSIGEYQKEDYRKAIQTLDKGIVHVDPNNIGLLSEFHSQRGSLFYEMDQKDSTFAEYDKALKYNPQNLGVLNNYAYYLSILERQLDKAEKMSSLTIKAEPTNPTYLDTYGWVLFQQGAYQMAKIYLEKAVKYSEEKEKEVSAEVLEHYGDVLAKAGEVDQAVEYWQKAKARLKEQEQDLSILNKKIQTKTYLSKQKQENIED